MLAFRVNHKYNASIIEIKGMTMHGFPYGLNQSQVSFKSEGETLVGHLYLPPTFDPALQYAAVIVTGSWTTVKEQMAGMYAHRLAEHGYPALAFDFRYFGGSSGTPRQFESPESKIQDIRNAISYLQSLPYIASHRIAELGICASSGYMAHAAARDERLTSLAMIAPWLHNPTLVKPLYGGDEAVQQRIEIGEAAQQKFEQTGEVTYVPAISTTDENAAMYGPFDYYLMPSRGAIPQWRNEFAVMSWPGWLNFNAIAAAPDIHIPTMIVHSESGAVPEGAHQFYDALTAPKDIFWTQGIQFDFYDQEPLTTKSLAVVLAHLRETL